MEGEKDGLGLQTEETNRGSESLPCGGKKRGGARALPPGHAPQAKTAAGCQPESASGSLETGPRRRPARRPAQRPRDWHCMRRKTNPRARSEVGQQRREEGAQVDAGSNASVAKAWAGSDATDRGLPYPAGPVTDPRGSLRLPSGWCRRRSSAASSTSWSSAWARGKTPGSRWRRSLASTPRARPPS